MAETVETQATCWTLDVEPDAQRTRAQEPPSDAPPAKRYALGARIGRGGMGEVRRIRDRVLQRDLVRKTLRQELKEDARAMRRFTNEARITAHLQHPGVVPVYDIGVMEDGRPYYTMQEVRGPLLGEAFRIWPLHRAVEAIRRVADVLALAHSHGVLHRDLKPDNVMVGEFGSVIVLDWGVARAEPPIGVEAFPGAVVGTAPYMAPEMARGALEQVGPWSDVWQLGCLLYELVQGRVPREGSAVIHAAARQPLPIPEVGDPGLLHLLGRLLAWEPSARIQNGREASEALTQWLEGADRRERGLAVVADAHTHGRRAEDWAVRAKALQEEAEAILSPLKPFSPASDKAPGWALEDQARAAEVKRTQELDLQEQALQAALRVDADLPEAHAALALLYRGRHGRSEAKGDAVEAARWEQRLRVHQRGEHADYLAGEGRLSVDFEGPIEIARYTLRGRRLVPVTVDRVDGPLVEKTLPRGSYLLRCGGHPVPALIERGGHWEQRVRPPRNLGPEDCWVPEGPFTSGGDPQALDGLPARRVHLQGFVIRRHPVTLQEYGVFLNSLADPERRRPKAFPDRGGERAYEAEAGALRVNTSGSFPWSQTTPVTNISWWDALAYAGWFADQSGQPWRLPHSLEWEKAARGVDMRLLPWGDFFEATWARCVDAVASQPRVGEIHSYPTDLSPYGVRGLVGNVRDFCLDVYRKEGPELADAALSEPLEPGPAGEERWVNVRGGAATSAGGMVRPATRLGLNPERRVGKIGFRLARSTVD